MFATVRDPLDGGAGEAGAVEKARADLERIRELRSRISGLERTTLRSRALATLPAFESLLPGGALQAGGAYAVAGSMTLLMGLLAGPSGAGAWCGVVGVPEFGAEAAARFGIDLARLALVPEPGGAWLAVTAALADALTVVVTRPADRVSPTDASRLAARLRQRDAVLICLEADAASASAWPGVEARLSVADSSWLGIGRGHGYPAERLVTVRSEVRGGRDRIARLRLPQAIRDGVPASGDTVQPAPVQRLERVS